MSWVDSVGLSWLPNDTSSTQPVHTTAVANSTRLVTCRGVGWGGVGRPKVRAFGEARGLGGRAGAQEGCGRVAGAAHARPEAVLLSPWQGPS